MLKFQKFYKETRGRFYNFLVRLTGDCERAADVFQDSYMRYWERYGRQEPNARLLFTIGRNAAIDGYRRRGREQPIEEAHRDSAPDQESALIVKESYRRVLAALRSLDPLERELLSLAADGELRYDDIAGIAGISPGNVKVKIHRARQKLRQFLQEDQHERASNQCVYR